MVSDDTLTLLQGCASLASMGQLAKAWQMWEDAENDQRGCSKTKEVKRRKMAAEANLKTKREADQAMYLAMQLGGSRLCLGAVAAIRCKRQFRGVRDSGCSIRGNLTQGSIHRCRWCNLQ